MQSAHHEIYIMKYASRITPEVQDLRLTYSGIPDYILWPLLLARFTAQRKGLFLLWEYETDGRKCPEKATIVYEEEAAALEQEIARSGKKVEYLKSYPQTRRRMREVLWGCLSEEQKEKVEEMFEKEAMVPREEEDLMMLEAIVGVLQEEMEKEEVE